MTKSRIYAIIVAERIGIIMERKIGFIGTGNIATAILNGIVSSKTAKKEDIYVTDINEEKRNEFKNKGFNAVETGYELARICDCIFLTIKPQFYDDVLTEIKDFGNKMYITVAPGITVAHIKKMLGESTRVIRTMPNTPALVGEGVTAVCRPDDITDTDFDFAKSLISSFSDAYIMDEKYLDAVISVSGSSPAYAYMFIDAIARSGESQGIDYNTALIMAAKTVLGSAKLLLSSPDSPEILIDKVCSKGGTTIEAVNSLKDEDFYNMIDRAMKKCTKRALELKK